MKSKTSPEADLSTSLYSLIAAYWLRYQDLSTAMRRTDGIDFDSPEREAAFSAQFAAGEKLDEALMAVCGFAPHFRTDAKIRANFLTLVVEMEKGEISTAVLKALLKSMPDLVHYSHTTGRTAS